MINRAKFDVCTSISFGEAKTDIHTARIALYTLDNERALALVFRKFMAFVCISPILFMLADLSKS